MPFNMRKLKSVFAFATAGATAMSLALGVLAAAEPRGLSLASLAVAALELGMLAVGYALPLSIWSRRFAKATSQTPHAIAGFFAPLSIAALSTQVQGVSVAGIASLSLAAGVSIGLLQAVRTWRPVPPPKPSLEELELAAEHALQQALAAADARPDIIPIHRPERVQDEPSAQVA